MEEQRQSGGRRLAVVILAAVLVIAAGGVGAYWFWFRTDGPVQAESEKIGPIYVVGDLTTNLNEPGRRAFIQVQITLELTEPKAMKEVENRSAAVRNEILGLLRSRSMEDVGGEHGMRQLAEQIKNHLNSYIPGGGIKKVHFTEFVVQ